MTRYDVVIKNGIAGTRCSLLCSLGFGERLGLVLATPSSRVFWVGLTRIELVTSS